jgi:diguanylate cyclase (GGDEF)-like protein
VPNDDRDRSGKKAPRIDTGPGAFNPPGRRREACVVVIYGPDLGKRAALNQSDFEIGRSPKSDLPIDQESVSRHHARIVYSGGKYLICDLGSTNGTYVNDIRVEQIELVDGDQLKIGQSILKFMSGENIEGNYHEEIHRLMTVDNLTQCFNKRYFAEALGREYLRATRYKRALSLVGFDIDGFRAINEAHGSVAGDHVLRQIGLAVKPRLRAQDVLARVDGEEFAALLPEVDEAGARTTGEKVRSIVNELAITFGGKKISCTVSVGVATLNASMAAATSLHRAAEIALYLAKSNGKNRVEG